MSSVKVVPIVALDFPSLDEARRQVIDVLGNQVDYKIGLEILTAVGVPAVVKFMHEAGVGDNVFLDGKLFDIPNTMAGAARSASGVGVKMFNIHALAGAKAIRYAADNKGSM